MACNSISKRITNLSFLLLLPIFTPLSLHAGTPGLELELTYDHKGFSLFLSGCYTTNYIEQKVKINPYKTFPDNISVEALPVYKASNTKTDNAISTALALSLNGAIGALLYITQKEIERRIENQNIDLYLERCDNAIKKTDSLFERLAQRNS